MFGEATASTPGETFSAARDHRAGNQVELWEAILAATKPGAVDPPGPPLGAMHLRDRVDGGRSRNVVTTSDDAAKFADMSGDCTRIAVGSTVEGWHSCGGSAGSEASLTPDSATTVEDPMLLHFTSGTTDSRNSFRERMSRSLSIIGPRCTGTVRSRDVHVDVSSPGWAEHTWSDLFAPWNAEAAVFVHNYSRNNRAGLLRLMQRCTITGSCAPPTVWRMLIQADLGALSTPSVKVVWVGEPLNSENIEQVRRAWGVTIRDGFGQTETSVQVTNTPVRQVRPGSMGRALPGFDVVLLIPATPEEADESEICPGRWA